jgi:hypothetical protein
MHDQIQDQLIHLKNLMEQAIEGISTQNSDLHKINSEFKELNLKSQSQ